jgi:hypothetical protein
VVGTRGNGRNGSLGPIVTKALQDVLGWKVKPGDAAGFVGALNQSFDLKTIEGTVVSAWTPRSYAVQSDLAGGLTGAQASIYTMAKTLVDQMLPLLDGLYPLSPASDAQDVAAVKDIVHSQLTNLVSEIGYLGGPRVMRVHHYLDMLMGITLNITGVAFNYADAADHSDEVAPARNNARKARCQSLGESRQDLGIARQPA